ncbi:MAG: hypothetical protein WDZ79_01815 [Candidatus Paceibacterota bacterium]
MDSQFQQDLSLYVNELDPELRSFLRSKEISSSLEQISSEFDLAEEEKIHLKREVLYILMGLKPLSSIADSLVEGVDADDEMLASIIDQVDEMILQPVAELIPIHPADVGASETIPDYEQQESVSSQDDSSREAAREALSAPEPKDPPRKGGGQVTPPPPPPTSHAPAPQNLPGAEAASAFPAHAPSAGSGQGAPGTENRPAQSAWSGSPWRDAPHESPQPVQYAPHPPYTPEPVPEAEGNTEPPRGGYAQDEYSEPVVAPPAPYIEGFGSFQETEHDHHNLSRDEVLAGIEDPAGEHGPRDEVSEEELRLGVPTTNDPDERYGEAEDPYREPIE